MGTGRRKSMVIRAMVKSGADAAAAWAISAAGGPPCWCFGLHGPRVCSVAT
jgi:hypothetical protein